MPRSMSIYITPWSLRLRISAQRARARASGNISPGCGEQYRRCLAFRARQAGAPATSPVWHYTNPFWRYSLMVAFWYALGYWFGGIWGILAFLMFSSSSVLSMKIINYIQHYGLRRIRLPNGRFERPQPQHSWSSDYRLFNWIYYNAQRHADHHAAASRPYPLLQHWDEDQSPQLPGPYGKMGGLAMYPSRWFKTMDPLVDRWRERYYPEVKDWNVYDSAAFDARPDMFETISAIMGASPRLSKWINRTPALLDILQDREIH